MSEDLAALERQRAELDQRIALAHQAARDEWNNRLVEIDNAVRQLARERGMLPVADFARKNVITLALGRTEPAGTPLVKVCLGYAEPEHAPSLAVEAGRTRADFYQPWALPSAAAVMALVRALLDEEASGE